MEIKKVIEFEFMLFFVFQTIFETEKKRRERKSDLGYTYNFFLISSF